MLILSFGAVKSSSALLKCHFWKLCIFSSAGVYGIMAASPLFSQWPTGKRVSRWAFATTIFLPEGNASGLKGRCCVPLLLSRLAILGTEAGMGSCQHAVPCWILEFCCVSLSPAIKQPRSAFAGGHVLIPPALFNQLLDFGWAWWWRGRGWECHVQPWGIYLDRAKGFRSSNQLFVSGSPFHRWKTLFCQFLSQWVVEEIIWA